MSSLPVEPFHLILQLKTSEREGSRLGAVRRKIY